MTKGISIAIDGPAAAGKSTLARRLASELGLTYVDTGALYRAIGCYALNCGIDTRDRSAVSKMLDNVKISLGYKDGTQRVYLNGEDLSEQIRLPQMSMAASNVSAIPEVRQFLLQLQRDMAKTQGVVMDGRDIGTVVLPNAELKIFLTATPEERTMRRLRDYLAAGQEADYESLLQETIKRDEQDKNRPIAPLKPAPDAVVIDSTELSEDKTLELLIKLAKERML